MNERIKELMKQSMIEYQFDMRFSPEKFAELIVGECAGIALKSGNITNKSEIAVAEANRIYHKIKEHFGVEE